MRQVYLDHCATTPVDPRVVEAMIPYYSADYGNASSIHSYGRRARLALEESRERIAAFIGASGDELFFTSGGTESDNYAVFGVARAPEGNRNAKIITTAIEHHAVLDPVESLRSKGYRVSVLKVDHDALVDIGELEKELHDKVSLCSVVHANNEVGTIQPLKLIASMCRDRGVPVHTDAVQSVGKIPVNVRELGVDIVSMSAHKLYGPKGIGAIFIRKGTTIDSLMKGGPQESNRRPGTENIPLAVGFAKAIEICAERMEEDGRKVVRLRDLLRSEIARTFENAIVNGNPAQGLPNVLSISFDSSKQPIDGEALIMGMDLHGVAVTSGSACTSGSLQPSHVLLAMGRDEQTARATIRFSLGRGTTEEDILYTVEALKEVVHNAERSAMK